ncbi:polysaccharide pyruvyl transferase family protein [Mangrovimonas cancribranchiae]|uniref:Polysaccharide pyruvyl transferase family protein n=1 Tax=Mangrovimonas cancribranchiae TaxID=3080055 RepID=A0AAU6P0V7_9FLAO
MKSKITVFGSTKDEIHIGCKALSNGLDNLIRKSFGENVLIQHISHRYLSQHFNDALMTVNKTTVRKNFFKKQEQFCVAKDRSYDMWLEGVKALSEKDTFLKLTLLNSDIVTINVEGTIHHNSLLGHQMLAIGAFAVQLGKPVYWTNVSVESENEAILKHAFRGAKKIAVREQRSFDYLKTMGVNPTLAFDTAVSATFLNDNEVLDNNLPKEPFCLFTGSNVKNIDLIEQARVISSFDLIPLYLPLGLNDYNDLKQLQEENIACLDYGDVSFSQILAVIDKAKFVVSGRHHLNILSLLAAKPFIAHKSNTWKIEGVLELLDYEYNFNLDMESQISYLLSNYTFLQTKLSSKIEKAKKMALNTFD